MKPLSPRILFISSSRYLSTKPINNAEFRHHGLLISRFSTSANSFHSSTTSQYQSRWQDEASRNVRVSVWWDFENCSPPAGVNVFKVSHSITAAIRENGIKGPIHITAFGDVLQLSRSNQEALSATGINLAHIPQGGKNSADRSLLVDLLYWVSQNPPPAHIFLISGDRDFAGILHRLRMKNYNVLLASPDSAPSVLCSAASIMWNWTALVNGENLTGKYFNQPPDGPHGSWYGHYRVPTEDPFAVTENPTCSWPKELAACSRPNELPACSRAKEQPACSRAKEQPAYSQVEELSESNSDSKIRPVPKAVVRLIRVILNSYPNGISMTELSLELRKKNIYKDLYGYKKFSHFLLSMPQVLKLQSGGDGNLFVFSAATAALKVHEPESTPGIATGPVTYNDETDSAIASKANGEDSSSTKGTDAKPSLPPTPKLNGKEPPQKSQESQKNLQDSPLAETANNAEVTEKNLHPVEHSSSMSEVGFFRRTWRKWFADKDVGSEKTSAGCPENGSGCGSTKNSDTEEKCEKSTCQRTDPVGPSSFSSFGKVAVVDEKTSGDKMTCQSTNAGGAVPDSISSSSNVAVINDNVGDVSCDKSSRGPGFFKQIIRWCKFWEERTPSSENLVDHSCENVNQKTVDSRKHEVFSKESFWNELEAFLSTPPYGSVLVLQSRSRDQMAQNLQKQGPLVLGSLSQSDLLHLVDLLISEKRWVEENPSQNYPFRLIRPAEKSSTSSHPPNSKGLRDIFLSTSSQSKSQRLPEHDGERRHSYPRTGDTPPVINKKSSDKSRNEILADCQKFVDDIVKEYPEGFNMGLFKPLFLERNGYPLEIQKLGYQKLVTLLQIMPGLKLEHNFIVPCGNAPKSSCPETSRPSVQENNVGAMANSKSEPSDVSRKDDDDLESPWEELGPVSNAGPKGNEIDLASKRRVKEDSVRQADHEYEPLSDYCTSDSEDEASSLTGSEGQGKPKINDDEDSSLLQILDSWYSSQEETNYRKEGSENVDGMAGCSQNVLKPFGAGMNTETPSPAVSCGRRKQRPFKSYSFVSDKAGDSKDKLIDGILGSLTKSGESRIHG